MPELPDLTAYLEAIAERALDRRLERLRVLSPFVLRTVEPPSGELEGRRLIALERLGKRLVLVLEEERFLVLHLMIAGRLLWKERAAKPPGRISSAELAFENGSLWLTEAGTKKRAAIHLVRGRAALAVHDPGGIEPLTADLAAFRSALARENRTLKRALTDPRIVAGIGNAYSDEILHAAELSPFARTGDLGDDAWERLHRATRATLELWIDRLRRERAGGFPVKVTAFRPDMAVHGRHGLPCPRCGGAVQRIVYAENEANYCPACQTGGKLLADRVLSQLLRGDWPKTLEELEERKARSRAGVTAGGAILLLALLGVSPSAADARAGQKPAAELRPRQDVELALPLPPREADPSRIARARAILGGAAREDRLGPFPLLTDVAAPALLARASRLAETFDATYRERYGLAPVGAARETLLLFAREADYRRYQGEERGIAEIAGAAGLAGGGVAATFVGERSDDEVLTTLAHEWAHLANRRALGPALPSWLDEGIAEDLGTARVDRDGRLLPGSWARLIRSSATGWTMTGGEASLRELHARLAPAGASSPAPPQLERVLGLDWSAFAAESDAPFHYALAGAFLRFLLSDDRLAPATRGWLGEVATGAPPEIEGLREALGLTWAELEIRLRDWISAQFAGLDPLPGSSDPPRH
jgi:formamidopyrimidine-DNA glycosylase